MRSARRSRSKARKPRYVSLRHDLAPPRRPPVPPVPSGMSSTAALGDGRHQLDAFPAQSEPLDRDPQVACLLDDRGAVGEPTLAAILGNGDSSSSGSPSPSMNWEDDDVCGEGDGDGDGLARRALRGRERWAYYWRASSRTAAASSSEEEVASSAASDGRLDLWLCAAATRALALKLDYEEILAAWSDRGPLYMDGDAPQVVPHLRRHGDPYESVAFPVLVEVGQGGGDAASTWKVPDKEDGEGREPKGEEEAEGGSVTISREARVRRYKEKRVNRLFAKRIRYEVRKTNAEKRPRVKGRFVKRNDDDEDL